MITDWIFVRAQTADRFEEMRSPVAGTKRRAPSPRKIAHRFQPRRLTIAALLVALIAAPAAAQVQTGGIFVKLQDQDGGVLPGVVLTISSSVLPRPITGATDAGGVYRFQSLTIGTYTVKAEMQGFDTMAASAVVLQGQTADVTMTMKIGSFTDAVSVLVTDAPVVDTKTAGIGINIDHQLLEKTPGGKDIWSLMEAKAPGVVMSGTPDVGGNQGGLQRGMTARGVPNGQNTQMLNGVNVADPASLGASMNYYTPETFDNVQVSTAAQDISVGTGGILINMVSRAGSNMFTGQISGTCQGDCEGINTQSHNVDSTLQALGLGSDSNTTGVISNFNAQTGGPLIRSKLFYFGSMNFQATHVHVVGFPAVPPAALPTLLADTSNQDTTDILAGEGKITFQQNDKSRFEGYLSRQRYDKPNRGASTTNTQDSNSKELDAFVVTQATWSYVPTGRMAIDTKLSYNFTEFDQFQKTTLQPLTDSTTSTVYRNRTSTSLTNPKRIELTSNANYSLPEFLGGRHDVRFGFDNGWTPDRVETDRIDNLALTMTTAAGAIKPSQVTVYSTPTIVHRALNNTAIYAQDQYSLKRLTVTGGIRWERLEGYVPVQHTPDSTYFSNGQGFTNITVGGVFYPTFVVKKTFDAVRQDPLWHDFAPRMAVSYVLDRESRTVVKFSIGKYLDQIGTSTPPNPNGTISQTYAWNDANGDLNFQPGAAIWDASTNSYVGGEFGALASTSIPTQAAFDKTLARPSRNELTVSLDREVMPGLLASLSFSHMREHNQQGTVDQSFDAWDSLYTLVPLTDPGRDGVLGTADDAPLSVYDLKPGAVTSNKTVNDDRLSQHYNGIEIDVTKRYSKGLQILGGYTYSHTRQDLVSLSSPNNVYVNASGESGGRRHNFKISGSYELPWAVQLAANYRIASGLPITRTWTAPACSASVTSNCLTSSATVNAEPRGSVELGALGSLDLRFGRFFTSGRGGKGYDVSIDVFNVTNANTTFSVRQTTSLTTVHANNDPASPPTSIVSFLSPTGVLSPRIVRFNVRYSF